MKAIRHGIYYYNSVNIICLKCGCKYEIDKNDIKKFQKPKKVWKTFIDDVCKEKYNYYTNCPECNYNNELEHRDYDILTTNIKK